MGSTIMLHVLKITKQVFQLIVFVRNPYKLKSCKGKSRTKLILVTPHYFTVYFSNMQHLISAHLVNDSSLGYVTRIHIW